MITTILQPDLTGCAGLEVIVGMSPSAACETLVDGLLDGDCKVYLAQSPEDAQAKLQSHSFHVAVLEENYSLEIMQLLASLPMVARRNMFYVLLGSAMETGNQMQSFVVSANLVVNVADVASFPQILQSALLENSRFYRPFYYALQAREQRQA
jgi:hypothetical protein